MSEKIIKPLKKIKRNQEIVKEAQLWLINDDFNTFDYVVETLIDLCNHQQTQAEQCALITHFKGKCSIKVGIKNNLSPICRAMLDRGLTAEIKS